MLLLNQLANTQHPVTFATDVMFLESSFRFERGICVSFVTCRAKLMLPAFPIESEENAQLSLTTRLAAAMEIADVPIQASCYCRLSSTSASGNAGGGGCCEEGTPPVDKDASRL